MNIELMQGDCIKLMKEMPDSGIDLTVTSPPYDNLRSYNGNNEQWGENIWNDVIKDLYRVTKNGGVVVWVVGDATIKGSETGTSFKQALCAMSHGFNLHDTMIWNKGGFSAVGSLQTRYAPVFEYMFVFSKGKPKTFNPLKDRKNKSHGRKITGTNVTPDRKNRKVSCYGEKIKQYGQRFNIWEMNAEMNRSIKHPAPFPEKLANDHIVSWSSEGDTVFDPFMGSGTTGLASEKLNRRFIGIELDEQYFKMAEYRILNRGIN